jgi:hypothetical protein
LNLIGFLCKSVSNKTRKRKEKRKEKEEKASGIVSSPTIEASHGPLSLPPETVSFSLSPCC